MPSVITHKREGTGSIYHLVQCRGCGSVTRSENRYCVCGAALSAQVVEEDAPPAADSWGGYGFLRAAVVVTRIVAVLYLAIMVMSSLMPVPQPHPAGFVVSEICGAIFGGFFMWVSGDVLRILLEIRDRLGGR